MDFSRTKSILMNKKILVLMMVVASIIIIGVCLVVSKKNSKPQEIDAPYGPEPFDLKTLKTRIYPTSEEYDMPEVNEALEMEY